MDANAKKREYIERDRKIGPFVVSVDLEQERVLLETPNGTHAIDEHTARKLGYLISDAGTDIALFVVRK